MRSARRAVGLIVITCAVARPAFADEDAAARAALERTLRQSAFFGAELNARHRAAVYASDAEDGPSGRSELRAFVYGSGDAGPLGLYLGLGAIARFQAPDAMIGDPFADPYDDFTFGRNIRLFSAHVEYAAEGYGVRAGRLSDFDGRSHLLVYDGVRGFFDIGDSASVFVYGGRRALLDAGLPDGRTDALGQLVAGAKATIHAGPVDLFLTYRLEELHRASARGAFSADDLFLDLSVEARIGGQTSLDAYDEAYADDRDDLGLALVIRHDGGFATRARTISFDWRAEVQLGRDPVSFGRGGIGPKQSDIQAALGSPIFGASLDRLFFGPQPAHLLGEVELEWVLTPWIVVAVGAFTRQPLSAEDRTSIRPGIVEMFGGPELRVAGQHRIGAQARYAVEDPGTPGRVFDDLGDGERASGGLMLYAELPVVLNETWRLAFRPEAEARTFTTRGPLAEATDQFGYYAGLYAAASTRDDLFVGFRYGAGAMPEFFADGVDLTHDLELTIGGRY